MTINRKAVKEICSKYDRRISEKAIQRLNAKVESLVAIMAQVHNGSKKTIDDAVCDWLNFPIPSKDKQKGG